MIKINTLSYCKDGWIFSDHKNNAVHEISQDELLSLIDLEQDDEEWSNRVQNKAREYLSNPKNISNYFTYFVTMENAAGTISQYPFGYILTFPSKKHLFRGESEIYEKSIPNLNRQIDNMDAKEKLMYRLLARLREAAFSDFLWLFGIVPAWEATICDVNYSALAQHYGFKTCLLDVTNDIKTALFFATCKYESETDSYRPLTWDDINREPGKTDYGMIYHAPDHIIDYNNGLGSIIIGQRIMDKIKDGPIDLQSGLLDGYAYQIGFQPLLRCRSQSAYVLPMKESKPLQEDVRFEKIRFRHTPELSEKIFKMFDGGRKIWPFEGIQRASSVISEIKKEYRFTKSQFVSVYNKEEEAKQFQNVEELIQAVTSYQFDNKYVELVDAPVKYDMDKSLINVINEMYRSNDLLSEIGGVVAQSPQAAQYRQQKYKEIYGHDAKI